MIYMVQAGGSGGPVKIGITDDIENRMSNLQIGHHQRLKLIRTFVGNEAEERSLHERFADNRLEGEWFSFSKLMLGDVGLTEIPLGVAADVARMNEIVARYEVVGDAVIAELTEHERSAMREMWGLLHKPAWQVWGLPDPDCAA